MGMSFKLRFLAPFGLKMDQAEIKRIFSFAKTCPFKAIKRKKRHIFSMFFPLRLKEWN